MLVAGGRITQVSDSTRNEPLGPTLAFNQSLDGGVILAVQA
jgi:hypothetical protein